MQQFKNQVHTGMKNKSLTLAALETKIIKCAKLLIRVNLNLHVNTLAITCDISGHIGVAIPVLDLINPLCFEILTTSHAALQVWSFDNFKAPALDAVVGGLRSINHSYFWSC